MFRILQSTSFVLLLSFGTSQAIETICSWASLTILMTWKTQAFFVLIKSWGALANTMFWIFLCTSSIFLLSFGAGQTIRALGPGAGLTVFMACHTDPLFIGIATRMAATNAMLWIFKSTRPVFLESCSTSEAIVIIRSWTRLTIFVTR